MESVNNTQSTRVKYFAATLFSEAPVVASTEMRWFLVAAALAISAAPVAADLEGETFTSDKLGLRVEIPRGWRVTANSGYPDVLLWLSRSKPRVKIIVSYDRIADACQAGLAAFCSHDPAVDAAALRTLIAAAGYRITSQEQSRTPELEYEANGRYLRHAVVVVDDLVVSVILAADTADGRSSQRRVFDRITQSVKPRVGSPAPRADVK